MVKPRKPKKTDRELDDPWFGFEGKPGEPPDRGVFFNMPEGRTVFDAALCIEDYLQHSGVFVNGMSNAPAHMDSYMTIVDYGKLTVAMERFDEAFAPTPEEMKRFIDHWLGNPNSQPPARLLAFELIRRYKIEKGALTSG